MRLILCSALFPISRAFPSVLATISAASSCTAFAAGRNCTTGHGALSLQVQPELHRSVFGQQSVAFVHYCSARERGGPSPEPTDFKNEVPSRQVLLVIIVIIESYGMIVEWTRRHARKGRAG